MTRDQVQRVSELLARLNDIAQNWDLTLTARDDRGIRILDARRGDAAQDIAGIRYDEQVGEYVMEPF